MASKPFAVGAIWHASDANELAGVYDRQTGLSTVVSTTVETTIYSKAIGAGHMASDRVLNGLILADWMNNSGVGGATTTLKVKLGATVVAQTSLSAGSSATRLPSSLEFVIAMAGTTGTQNTIMRLPSVAPATLSMVQESLPVATSVSMTGAVTLSVTVTHNTSSASLDYRPISALLILN